MSNDNKTLAGAQPGGRVRLGDQAERARFEDWGLAEGLPLARGRLGGYAFEVTAKAWIAWQHLAAQPSPGGQGDDSDLLDELRDVVDYFQDVDPNPIHLATVHAAIEVLAARQPVGEPVAWYYSFSDTGEAGPVTFGGNPGAEAIAWAERHGHTLHYLYAAPAAQTVGPWPVIDRVAKNWDGCSIGPAIRAEAEKVIGQPAQAVDLSYSLDADPVGIRARVADVITGTLMVAAQGHTPPPAGHWAEPFWQAARHDAARSLNVTLKLRELVAASKYMRDRVVETRGVKCMDDLDYAIDEAEKALTDSQAVGNG